jgi:hypothetical protein
MKKTFLFIAVLLVAVSSAQVPLFQSVSTFGGNGHDAPSGMTSDDEGNIYLTGIYNDTADFDPGPGVAILDLPATAVHAMFITQLDSAGNFGWVKCLQSTIGVNSTSIKLDNEGNIYSVGHFQGTVDLDPGTGVFPVTATSAYPDLFILKLDNSGNFVWAATFAGPSLEAFYDLEIDVAGNVYSTGYFYNTVDFDPGAGSFPLSSFGAMDVFVLKLSGEGVLGWVKQLGGPGDDYPRAMKLDQDANVYTTGTFTLTADFDPGPDSCNYTGLVDCSHNMFLSKLDSSGNFVWCTHVQQLELGSTASGDALAIADNHVFVTGAFGGTADFDPLGDGCYLTSTYVNQFVLKYSLDGNFKWVRQIFGIGPAASYGRAIAIDEFSRVVTAGVFDNTCDFDPGDNSANMSSMWWSKDCFIQVLDSLGNFVWADIAAFGPSGGERVESLLIDEFQHLYLLGEFNDSADFNASPLPNFIHTAGVSTDIFLSKFSMADVSGAIADMSELNSISVFPNPSSGQFFVSAPGPYNVEVYNSIGQLLFASENVMQDSPVMIEALAAGIYFVKVEQSELVVTKKVIIER